MHAHSFSCVQLFETLWTVAHQVPLSIEFPKQEYWCGLLFPPPGELPNPGIKAASPVSPALADSLPLSHLGSPDPMAGGTNWGNHSKSTYIGSSPRDPVCSQLFVAFSPFLPTKLPEGRDLGHCHWWVITGWKRVSALGTKLLAGRLAWWVSSEWGRSWEPRSFWDPGKRVM